MMESQPSTSNTSVMNASVSSLPSSTLNTTGTPDSIITKNKKVAYDKCMEETRQAENSLAKPFGVLSSKPSTLFPEVSTLSGTQELYNLKPILERYGAEACAQLLQQLHKEARTCLAVSEAYLVALENLFEDACQVEDEGGLTRQEALVVYDTLLKASVETEVLRAQEQGIRVVCDFVESMEEPAAGVAPTDKPKTFADIENLASKLKNALEEYAAIKSGEVTQERRSRWEDLLKARDISIDEESKMDGERTESPVNNTTVDSSLLSEDEM